MADTKISQLPAATTPLSGAEVVPLVQSGATVQTPVNEISLLTAATANTFTANQIISVTDNTNAALRVTQLGTGLALRIEDSTNPDSTPVVVDASGNVGIGTAAPANILDVSGAIRATGVTTPTSGAGVEIFYSSNIGYIIPYDRTSVAFKSLVMQALSITFTTGAVPRLTIDSSGNILNTSSGGLGYGTGSGGTITQLTSKTTGVTLNKTNGQIITSNALMAGGAEITFTVTNSTVAATDTIILHRASGGGAGSVGYTVYVDSTAAGSFVIYIKNLFGTSKSEAITLNFAVIKAVTS